MGYLRLLLALSVLVFHVSYINSIFGCVALMGFFAVSGFLVTRAVNEVYAPTLRGKALFFVNRMVRIYPTYWVCLAVTIGLIYYAPVFIRQVHPAMYIPSNTADWLHNLFIVGLSNWSAMIDEPRIVPPAWSLSTELFYYLLIGIVCGHHKKFCTLCFAVMGCFVAYQWNAGMRFNYFYYAIPGPGIIFMAGSMLYHYQKILAHIMFRRRIIFLTVALLGLTLPDIIRVTIPTFNTKILLAWLGTALIAYSILGLYLSQARTISMPEQWAADLSYPVFLLHWQSYAIAKLWLPSIINHGPISAAFISTIIALALAALVVLAIERPLKKIRNTIRSI